MLDSLMFCRVAMWLFALLEEPQRNTIAQTRASQSGCENATKDAGHAFIKIQHRYSGGENRKMRSEPEFQIIS